MTVYMQPFRLSGYRRSPRIGLLPNPDTLPGSWPLNTPNLIPGSGGTTLVPAPLPGVFQVAPGSGVLQVPRVSSGGVVGASTQPSIVPKTPVNTVVVTPTSGPIPPPTAVPAAVSAGGNSIMDFLTGSMIGGIPNWVFVAGAGILLLGGKKK